MLYRFYMLASICIPRSVPHIMRLLGSFRYIMGVADMLCVGSYKKCNFVPNLVVFACTGMYVHTYIRTIKLNGVIIHSIHRKGSKWLTPLSCVLYLKLPLTVEHCSCPQSIAF